MSKEIRKDNSQNIQVKKQQIYLANCSLLTSKVCYKCVVFSQSSQKVKINWWCYLMFQKKTIFLQEIFFLEKIRNQGENLEKIKKQPCKAKKPEF